MCSNHLLNSVKPVAGQTATTGYEGLANMTLHFTAVCGYQTQQMLDGRFDFDQPNGLVYSRRNDKSL
eukprot:8934963-Pyramimonas_sp.AAC.1